MTHDFDEKKQIHHGIFDLNKKMVLLLYVS